MYVGKKSIYSMSVSNSKATVNNDTKNNDFDFENVLKDSQNQNSKRPTDIYKGNSLSERSIYGGQTTDRGTKIIQPGEDMDKNAFLRILAAQMSNQDPTQEQNGTEYISQFAQFAAMEQMSNLNSTMSAFASQSLIGKGVMLNAYDKNGQIITGIVRSVAKNGSRTLVSVEYLDEKGQVTIGEFEDKDIISVIDMEDNRLDYINNNMAMLLGAGMMNKNVKFVIDNGGETSSDYETMDGEVKGVIVEDYSIKLKVKVRGSGEIKIVDLDKVLEVDGEKYENIR